MNSFIVAHKITPKKSHLCTPPSVHGFPVFGMDALILQNLLKHKIIWHSSFQKLDFLVVLSGAS